MTITYTGEDPTKRQFSQTASEVTFVRVLQFESDSQLDDEIDVLGHASCPGMGSAHPRYAGAWLLSRTLDNANGWKGWALTCNYSSKFEMAEDPTNDPPRIAWNTEQFQRPLVFDKDGDGVVNSAGDPFDPQPMVDDSRRTVTIRVNVSSVPSYILSYQDTVNSDAFTLDGFVVSAGLAKVQSVSVSEVQTRNDIDFREVALTLHLQKNGWHVKPLDAGFREISGTARINIVNDGDKQEPTAPVPLNGSGAQLANPTPSNAVFLDFTAYSTAVFAGNLPGCS